MRLCARRGRRMEIIVHFGAHRCATTSFQHYVQHNFAGLAAQGVAVWDRATLSEIGLLGLGSMTMDSFATVQKALDRCQDQGVRHLLISEENFLGLMPENVNKATLYPNAGLRAQIVSDALGGRVAKVALNIRSLDTYWSSVAGYAVRNPSRFKGQMRWGKVADDPRSWRNVITDLSAAFPAAPLYVLPFEEFVGRPDQQLAAFLGTAQPLAATDGWHNKDGNQDRLAPTSAQNTKLILKYADDLSWLDTGADGLAHLCLLHETQRDLPAPADTMNERKSP